MSAQASDCQGAVESRRLRRPPGPVLAGLVGWAGTGGVGLAVGLPFALLAPDPPWGSLLAASCERKDTMTYEDEGKPSASMFGGVVGAAGVRGV